MTTTNPPEQDTPPRPTTAATVADFGRELRNLRRWSKLTQLALEDMHPALTDSTISDHERGVRLPRLEWLQAYVTACLRKGNPAATRVQLDAEFAHWRAAWTRLERSTTSPTGAAVPTPRAATIDTTTAPAPVDTREPATPAPAPPVPTAATGTPTRRRVRLPRTRVLLVGSGVVVLVVAAAVYAAITGLFDTEPGPGPAQFTGTTPPAPIPAVYASGTVDNLGTKEGADLDTGQRLDQNAPGVDISFSSASTHMDAMDERVSYQVLPQPVAQPEKHLCEMKDGWERWYADVHTLTEGRNICVKTDEGRLSMMTVTKRATDATGTISLRYTTWP